MNYSENYLKGANLLDSEMERFEHNPAEFVACFGLDKDKQAKAELIRYKLTLDKKDYLMLEKAIDILDGNIEDNSVQDYIDLLFAIKIIKAIS